MPHEILHILGTANAEGVSMARIVAALARGLDPERFRLHAWFLAGDGSLVGMLEQAGVQASSQDWWRGARDPAGAWKFWHRLRGEKFDIVQIHFGGRSVRWLVRAGTRAKIVVHLHGRVIEPLGLHLVTHSCRGADAVVATSKAVARQVAGGAARVIYPGVAAPPEAPVARRHGDSSEIILGSAGRLIELKGLEYLLNAAAALRAEFPGFQVEIAGSGPHRSKLEQMVERLELKGQVKFLGWVDDLKPVLPRWDIFVMPSLEEGFGISALEAMAAGLPVVATLVGGVPELIEEGKTGWLVPPADAAALASRLRLLLIDPQRRMEMGAAAQARVRDHFSPTQMVESFRKLYDELLVRD